MKRSGLLLSTAGMAMSQVLTAPVDLSLGSVLNGVVGGVTTLLGDPAVLLTATPLAPAILSFSNLTALAADQNVAVLLDVALANPLVTETTCSLLVTLDGVQVLDQSLANLTAGTTLSIETDPIAVGANPDLDVTQLCPDESTALHVSDVRLNISPLAATSATDISTGAPTDIATETVVPSATATDSDVVTATDSDTATATATATETATDSESATGTETGTELPTETGSATESATETATDATATETDAPTGTETASDSASETATGTATNTDDSTATGTETGTMTPTATATPGFPQNVDNFVFFGCLGSSENFPTFTLGLSSANMDIDTCIAVCGEKAFAGVYRTECYCGDDVNPPATALVDPELCDIPCPGDDSEFCGGNKVASLARRQANIPNTLYLTLYVNIDFVVSTTTVTSFVPTTVTSLVPVTANGSVVTVTSLVPTSAPTSVTNIVVCYSGVCGNNFVFVGVPGADCFGQIVYVAQPCGCAQGGLEYKPMLCDSEACTGATVFKPKACDGHCASDVVVFQPQPCDTCHGGVVYQQAPGQKGAVATVAAPGAPGAPGAAATPAAPYQTVAVGGQQPGGVAGSLPGAGANATRPAAPFVTAGSDRVVASVGLAVVALVAAAFM